ncbi:MraY family glycosyltransferase [uncultured Thiohalocapsa sp.]|uniref:MraY family glycosyltransferase n=1 Tax=uncultured Thiohalocapsa sp. TaxID=768990 RepID=UPI0025F987EA|nr:MraY family glycosyltransferase [uncultured Thiohalocapsa sp.]
MDNQTLLIAVLAFGVAALLSLLLRAPARMLGLVDHPDARKTHRTPTPLTGGVAIFLAFSIGLTLAGTSTPGLLVILGGGAFLVLLGLLDDIYQLHYRTRLVGQAAAAACLVIGADVHVDTLGNLFGLGPIDLGPLAILFSIFAVVGLINAINMLDGLDGLAGSVACVSLAGVLLLANAVAPALTMPAAILAAAVLGFLSVNIRFPWCKRAHVFMGDAGSTFLGYCLAWFVIALPQQAPAEVPPIAALWLVGLPVADTLATIWRRKRQGLSAFEASHNHIHHLLQRAGFSVNVTLLIIVLAAILFVSIALDRVFWQSLSQPALFGLYVLALAATYKLLQRVAPRRRLWRRRQAKRRAEPAYSKRGW